MEKFAGGCVPVPLLHAVSYTNLAKPFFFFAPKTETTKTNDNLPVRACLVDEVESDNIYVPYCTGERTNR